MTASRVFALLAVAGVAGCSGAGASLAPSTHSLAVVAGATRHAADTATGMPGDTATGMPGDTATGMPGTQFACAPSSQPGSASCSIEINVTIAPQPNPNVATSLISGWHPADLQSAYALPSQNVGGTVAIVDAYDDPLAESDLAVYRNAFGLPPCTTSNGCFRKLNGHGAASPLPPPSAAWSREIALDLDMVSAACPKCSIVLLEAPSALIDDLGAAVDAAAGLGVRAISNSYYTSEWANELAEDVHFQHPGIAITVSSGDRGTASYPAASPFVTSVGGTTLSRSSGGFSESSWAGTGHGCSAYEPKPHWQDMAPCATRSTVDVAAVADPATGVASYDSASGGWQVVGGTSASAPLVAAGYALSQPAGPAFSYANAGAFHPIGGAGYTLAAGLGSPAGVAGL